MKVVVIGGHLSPAYALIKELQKRGHTIYFFGRKTAIEGEKALSFEYEQITKLGVPFIAITSGRLQRRFTFHTIPSLLKIPYGFFQSTAKLFQIKPDVIIGFGGYLSVPVILAGFLLGIKSITHEQTRKLGLANKINKSFVKRIAVSFEETLKETGSKGTLTGNPIRSEVFETRLKNAALKKFLMQKGIKLFVTGGAQGSHKINLLIEENLEQLLGKYLILHQVGRSTTYDDYGHLNELRSRLNSDLQSKYFVCEYVEPQDIGGVLSGVDLVISRAGANITQELLLLGKKAILIPILFASNLEQLDNAKMLVGKNLAKIISEDQLGTADLIYLIDQVLKFKPVNQAKIKVENDPTRTLAKLIESV